MHDKTLNIFCAHLDDLELSCLGFLFQHHHEYSQIKLFVASYHEYKDEVTKINTEMLSKLFKKKIQYVNLNHKSRYLYSSADSLKECLYNNINFKEKFDILTHGKNDLHTDHIACSMIANGIYKYCERYVEFYSPSSKNFDPNYFISLTKEQFEIKSAAYQKYDINKDDSFTKIGYYFNDHWNIGKSYVLENFVNYDSEYYEIYRITKWV